MANVTVDCDSWNGWLLGSLVVISDICDTDKVDVEVAPVVNTLPLLVGTVGGGVDVVAVGGGVDVVVAVVLAVVVVVAVILAVGVDGGVGVCSNVVESSAVVTEVVPV